MPDMIPVVDTTEIVPWSFSKMMTFETCPRQYEAKYVLKSVPFVQNEAAKWGDDVHKALENNLRYGMEMPSNMAMYQRFADAVRRFSGEIVAERQVAVNPHLMETGYFDGDVWVRAKIDVTIINGNKAKVLDWKTGKMKDDPKQLMFYALLVFIMHPQVEEVQAGFVWLKDGVVTPPATFRKEQFGQMLSMWVSKYNALKEAHNIGVFPPRPSGLCKGWCEVTSCEHWEPKRKK